SLSTQTAGRSPRSVPSRFVWWSNYRATANPPLLWRAITPRLGHDCHNIARESERHGPAGRHLHRPRSSTGYACYSGWGGARHPDPRNFAILAGAFHQPRIIVAGIQSPRFGRG